jgi:methionyl-tRNA formyltransferase
MNSHDHHLTDLPLAKGEMRGLKRILFFGTSEFAVPSFEALLKDTRFELVGLVTQPDRPVGRHAVLTAPPVKQCIVGTIPIMQPEKIKDEAFQTWIRELGPTCDAFVVVSYGKILPQWLLDLPKHGVVNVHGSLLPRWRGASPIQAAIAAGDAVSGVTIMQLDAEMDHGPIIAQAAETILPTDTGQILHDRLANVGGFVLPDALMDFLNDETTPIEQDHSTATHCKTLSREDGKIDWTKSAKEIERLVRAYTPWPGTYTEVDGKRLKILSVLLPQLHLRKRETSLMKTCGDGNILELTRVQPEGKNPMSGEEFLRGCTTWLT